MYETTKLMPRSLPAALASSLVVMVLFIAYLLLVSSKRSQEECTINIAVADGDSKYAKDKTTSPPMAKAGILETVKILTGNKCPWFLLDTARDLQSNTFRLNLSALLSCPMVAVVSDPKVAHEILRDPLTTKPEQLYRQFEDTMGTKSILTSNGEFWHSRRKGMAPAFSSKHIKRMNKVSSEKADEWIQTRLSKFVDNDQAFDVGKEMISITLSAITETAFEYHMSDEEKQSFVHELGLSLKEFSSKSLNPLRKPFGLLIPERRRAHLAAKRLQAIALKIINAYRELEDPTKDTIIDRIMHNSAYKNDSERVSDVLILLIAGHENTAYSIAWILKELAKNRQEQQHLRDSLNSLGKEGWNQSTALRNVVQEGRRLHPVTAVGSSRTIGRDFTTDKGHLLPKGTIAIISFIVSFRNTDIYEDADAFIPARWDEPTNEMKDAFYPFSAGKQNCVGQSLANAMIRLTISKICSEFELELVDEGETDFFVTLKPVNVMLKAKKVV
jgi:cytochrome P450